MAILAQCALRQSDWPSPKARQNGHISNGLQHNNFFRILKANKDYSTITYLNVEQYVNFIHALEDSKSKAHSTFVLKNFITKKQL